MSISFRRSLGLPDGNNLISFSRFLVGPQKFSTFNNVAKVMDIESRGFFFIRCSGSITFVKTNDPYIDLDLSHWFFSQSRRNVALTRHVQWSK